MTAQRRRPPLDAQTLARVRVDYEESDLTVERIGIKYNRSPSFICRLARYYGWLMRSERNGHRPRAGAWGSYEAREAIAQRLSRVINSRLDQLEKGMQDGSLTPEAAESGAKQVASMIGGFDKVTPLGELPGEDKQRTSKDSGGIDEVERLQREIIERFERIQRRRQAEAGSK